MSKIYGLLGEKLSHSYSVPIHMGLGNESYKLYELKESGLEAFLRQKELGGVNVTIPYKQKVMPFLDEISQEAKKIGAVNTVVNRNGRLYGYNTDKYGFEIMLDRANIDVFGKKVIILGSGGASKTAVYCCEEKGARECLVISRSGENNYGNIDKHFDAQVIINCTPVGMHPDYYSSLISLSDFKNCEGVVDLIYNPMRTKLLLEAEDKGIKNIGGLIMLCAQAIKAHELFFDIKLPDTSPDDSAKELAKKQLNIALIGMPGCGKTTVGKELSKISGREIIELDEEIVKYCKKSIPEIFEEDGEEAFRKTEALLLSQFAKEKGKIIVTGGGAVTREENYLPLKMNSKVYEIKRDITCLATDSRPLSVGGIEKLKAMYKTRKPMYDRFKDVSFENSSDVETAAKAIWEDFCENTRY